MGRLLLLFIALPALELWLLIEIGRRIGTLNTVAIIVLTGAVGAALARHQGLQVIGDIQGALERGRVPGEAWVEGALILVSAALLVTPGVLTDAFGFLCLIPGPRRALSRVILSRLQSGMRSGRFRVYTQGPMPPPEKREERDITPPKSGS